MIMRHPINRELPNQNYLITAAPRSGKTAFIQNELSHKRMLAWDPDGEYLDIPGVQPVYTRADLLQIVEDNVPGKYSYIAPVSQAEFEYWSIGVMRYRDCDAVAEEIIAVTSPGKAPHQFGQLVTQGSKRGIRLFVTTQFPAESSKTILRNSRFVICFRMGSEIEYDYMAKRMGVDINLLKGLKTVDKEYADFVWCDRFAGDTAQKIKLKRLVFD